MSYKADWHDDLDLAQLHYAGDSKNRLLLLRQPSLSVESFNPVNKDEGNIDYGYDDCDLMVAFAIQAGWTAEAYRACKIQWLVLDEADEMLNMGFKEELDKILTNTPEQKQTLLFSATFPKDV